MADEASNGRKWRVGGKVPLNVYEGDRPMFQCHTPEDASRVVELLNKGGELAELERTLRHLTIENEANMELARRLSERPDAPQITLELLRDEIVARIPDDDDALIKIRATVCHFVWVVNKRFTEEALK
jgi:hypothetical protein